MKKKLEPFVIEMDTLAAGLFPGKQLARWCGYEVDVMKKPIEPIDPSHVMTYSFSVPYGVRGITAIYANVEPDKITLTF